MYRSPTQPDRAGMHPAFRFQRIVLAACIVLAPVTLALYVLSWPVNPANVVNAAEPSFVVNSAMAGPLGNTLHFVGAIAASFFLPIGYLGMSLLGMRRSPWLATLSAALSLVGWIPWAALMGIDDLAYLVVRVGRTPELDALWMRFNDDTVMHIYLFIYIVGHLLSAVTIAIMLRRLRLIPAWAAWALALTSPLTMIAILNRVVVVAEVLRIVLMAMWIAAVIPAALAMWRGKDLEGPAAAAAYPVGVPGRRQTAESE